MLKNGLEQCHGCLLEGVSMEWPRKIENTCQTRG